MADPHPVQGLFKTKIALKDKGVSSINNYFDK